MDEARKKEIRSHAKGILTFLPEPWASAMERADFERRNAKFLKDEMDHGQMEEAELARNPEAKQLAEDLKNGVDIHRKTAAALFKVASENVTPEQLRAAKLSNFGLLYGGPQKPR